MTFAYEAGDTPTSCTGSVTAVYSNHASGTITVVRSSTWVPPPRPTVVKPVQQPPGWQLPPRTHRLVGTRHGFHQMARLPNYRGVRVR